MLKRTKIAKLIQADQPQSEVLVRGWVRTRRDAKDFSFIELNDGSSLKNIQIIANNNLSNYEDIKELLKLGNIYFDFKHWDEFRTDASKYSQKVKKKLNNVKGAKCFVINIVKRTDSKPVESVDETIVQIPYLIDGEKGIINYEAIDYISERC